MDNLLRDVRFGLRNLLRDPVLALVVMVSLALGIGANTAIFSLIRSVVLTTIPAADPGRLVLLHWHADEWPAGLSQSGSGGPSNAAYAAASRSLAYPFFRQLASHDDVFESVFAFTPLGAERQSVTLAADDGAERVDGEMVSGDYFRGLGVQPSVGRLLLPADEQHAAHAAVISFPYWQRRFGGDPSVVGRDITINHLPFTVVGVTSRQFFGVEPGRWPDVWVPMLDDTALVPWGFRPPLGRNLLETRDYWWTHVMARLAPGVRAEQAASVADAMFQGYVADALPGVNRAKPPHLGFEAGGAGIDTLRSSYERPLYLLMGMVGLVLLIACANVAVLLLSRSTARRRELALRLSLGAARLRLVRQLLTESLLMAISGGVLGILCAGWTSRALLLLVPPERRPLLDAHVDGTALLFAAIVSLATAIVFGLAPALVATRVDLLPVMRQAAAGAVASEPPAQKAWSAVFVITQVALSLVLLVAATLFVRTLTNLQHQALGVDDQRLLVFGVDASQNGYEGARLVAVYQEILRRLDAIPGAQGASASRLRLFSGWVSNGSVSIPGIEPKPSMNLNTNAVAPGFAATTGMRILAGRDISPADLEGHRRVAVITEEAARYFFGRPDVIGQHYSQEQHYDPAAAYEIVGVVSNARYSQVRGERFPRTAYVPFTSMRGELHGLYFSVRAAGDPSALAAAARAAVQSVDSSLAVVDMAVMADQVANSLWQERLFARLTGFFSGLALALACIGLYGTISYGAGRRRAEIALRIALGARRGQVQWLVLRRAVLLAIVGVAIGVPLALWAGDFVASFLYGLRPRDPATLAVTALMLIAIASLAGYVPARRASMVEPARALKQD